jgi:hypothetical protein
MEQHWKRSIETTEESVIDRVLSKSYIAVLSDENKANTVSRLREIVQRGEGKIWIDEVRGIFQYPYQTDLVISSRPFCEVPSD